MSTSGVTPLVLCPSVSAARLGLTVPNLVALIRKHGYPFTELAIGGRPGDRGRNRWGLTEAQLATIVQGQQRQFKQPEPQAEPEGPRRSSYSPDGISRLRRGRQAARRG